MILKVQLSYDRNQEIALQKAHQQWRNNIFKNILMTELITPQQFDAAGEFVQSQELYEHVRISPDPQQHIEWLHKDMELGFDELILHNVNREQKQFIDFLVRKSFPLWFKNQDVHSNMCDRPSYRTFIFR
ncbi:F420-dependent glucose-6-phosphate dehydrogenase [Calothrix sp. NIES-2100]|nr:F420-dependent glucose-6-phosphate dehydrogenase [Calothrix sp. NIES-2100]